MTTKIISSTFTISSPSYGLCPPAELPEFSFIGRSNVGKSSLINAICGKKEFARTSAKPGKTQLINYFQIESKDEEETKVWNLVDLPGYGYAKVAKDMRDAWGDVIQEYMTKRKNMKRVFVLIDSKLPPQRPDLEFIDGLNQSRIPFSIVFTKSDKVSQKDLSGNVKEFMNELGTMMPRLPDHFITSAEKKGSTQKLLDYIHSLA